MEVPELGVRHQFTKLPQLQRNQSVAVILSAGASLSEAPKSKDPRSPRTVFKQSVPRST